MKWKLLCDSFAARFASVSRQIEISSRLDAIKRDDFKEKDNDEYMVLDRLTRRINQLALMARLKDRDDEANVRFLT